MISIIIVVTLYVCYKIYKFLSPREVINAVSNSNDSGWINVAKLESYFKLDPSSRGCWLNKFNNSRFEESHTQHMLNIYIYIYCCLLCQR